MKDFFLRHAPLIGCGRAVEIKHLGAIGTGLNKLKREIKEKYQEAKKGLDEDIETLEALKTTAGKIEDREDGI